MHDYFTKKLVLSSSPTSHSDDYIAVAILEAKFPRRELAFCKKGDETWTMIQSYEPYYEDVIFYKGLIYVVNERGSLLVCDVSGLTPSVTVISPPPPVPINDYNIPFLVDSFGELLLVIQYHCVADDPNYDVSVNQTVKFEVFRLDSSAPKWVEVKSLGDCMLFVGTSSSLCLLATDFFECEGNCIYFTGEYVEPINDGKLLGNHDSGVFNLGDGCVKTLPYCNGSQRLVLPPPIWFTPNPC